MIIKPAVEEKVRARNRKINSLTNQTYQLINLRYVM